MNKETEKTELSLRLKIVLKANFEIRIWVERRKIICLNQ
jgi:hypothetical protein